MTEARRVGPDYPEFVERSGRRYSGSVDTDREGMIEHFQLFDNRRAIEEELGIEPAEEK